MIALLLAASIQLFGDSTTLLEAPYLPLENHGVNGTRASDPLPVKPSAQVVVFNFGMNEARPEKLVPIEEYKANLRALVKSAPARVFLQTPNPATRIGWHTAPYAKAMREVAAEMKVPVIDVQECFQKLPDWPSHLPDGIHPDAAGLRYIADVCVGPRLKAP